MKIADPTSRIRITWNKEMHTFLFYVLYTLVVVKELFLARTNIDDIISAEVLDFMSSFCMFAFFAVGAIIILFFQKYTIKEALYIGIASTFFVLSAYTSGSVILLEAVILIACSKSIKFDEFLRFAMRLQLIIIAVVVLLSSSGVIGMGSKMRVLGYEERLRYSMGFNHPNTVGVLTFQWIAEYIYLNRKSVRFKSFFLCAIAAIVSYMITNSNTAFLATILFIALCFVYRALQLKDYLTEEQLQRITRAGLVIVAICIILIVRYYWLNPSELTWKTMLTRLKQARMYLNGYGIGLLGKKIKIGSAVAIPGYAKGYHYLDNGYLWLFIKHGVAVALLTLGTYLFFIKKMLKQCEWVPVFIGFVFLIYAISETLPFCVYFNIFLIHMGSALVFSDGRNDVETIEIDRYCVGTNQ